MGYPAFTAHGTVSVHITTSTTNPTACGKDNLTTSSDLLYIAFNITSSSSADTAVAFTKVNNSDYAAGGTLQGPFSTTTTYYPRLSLGLPGGGTQTNNSSPNFVEVITNGSLTGSGNTFSGQSVLISTAASPIENYLVIATT